MIPSSSDVTGTTDNVSTASQELAGETGKLRLLRLATQRSLRRQLGVPPAQQLWAARGEAIAHLHTSNTDADCGSYRCSCEAELHRPVS